MMGVRIIGEKLVQESPISATEPVIRRRDKTIGCQPQQVLRTFHVHGGQGDRRDERRRDHRWNGGLGAEELWEVHGAVMKSIIIELLEMMMF